MLRPLFDNYWITKDKDPELYRKMRNLLNHKNKESADIKYFLIEELGYEYSQTINTVKIIKRPHRAFPWMGIDDFKSVDDYVFFMLVLSFLVEFKEKYFTFMDIKAYLDTNCQDELTYDWKNYFKRLSFQRAIKQAVSFGLIKFIDGDIRGDFVDNDNGFDGHVALFENRFLAGDFLPEYNELLLKLNTYEDFMNHSLEPYEGTYRGTDAIRRTINRDEGGLLSTTPFDERRLGGFDNGDQNRRIVLSINKRLREMGLSGENAFDQGVFMITKAALFELLLDIKAEEGPKWTKKAKETYEEELFDEILDEMVKWRLLIDDGDLIKILPSVPKMIGHFIMEEDQVEEAYEHKIEDTHIGIEVEDNEAEQKEQLSFDIKEDSQWA